MSVASLELVERLESDELLSNAADISKSKVVIGTTKLVEQEPKEAVEHFESGLSEEHTVPALWLGKAYAEAMISSPEREYAKFIHRSARRAFEHCRDEKTVVEQYGGILSVALLHSSEAINQSIQKAAKVGEEAVAQQSKAFWSAVGSVASAGAAVASDSDVVQVAGVAGAAGAGAKSVDHAGKAEKLKALKEDVYGVALGHFYYSLPLAKNAIRIEEACSPETADLLEETASRWKESVVRVMRKEVSRGKGKLQDEGENMFNTAIKEEHISEKKLMENGINNIERVRKVGYEMNKNVEIIEENLSIEEMKKQ